MCYYCWTVILCVPALVKYVTLGYCTYLEVVLRAGFQNVILYYTYLVNANHQLSLVPTPVSPPNFRPIKYRYHN